MKAKFTSLYGLYVLMSRISAVNNEYALLRPQQNVNYRHSGASVEIAPRESSLLKNVFIKKERESSLYNKSILTLCADISVNGRLRTRGLETSGETRDVPTREERANIDRPFTRVLFYSRFFVPAALFDLFVVGAANGRRNFPNPREPRRGEESRGVSASR